MGKLVDEIREALKPHHVEEFTVMCFPIPTLQQVDLLIAEVERLTTEVATLQTLVPHPGDGTCERCGTGGAKTVTAALCEECRELEREIAYHAARSDIECICEGHYENGPGSTVWYDLQSPDNDADRGFIAQAETYLASRHLLKRHPENQNWVRPLDAEGVRP